MRTAEALIGLRSQFRAFAANTLHRGIYIDRMNALCGLRGLACWFEPSLFATASGMFLRGATHMFLRTPDLTYSYDDMTST